MIFEAIDFAVKAHRGQFRKGTRIPFIIHPLNIARILISCDSSPEVVAAGILHDTVEDAAVTFSDLREAFGQKVAEIVETVSVHDKSESWEVRKGKTIDTVRTTREDALLVEIADKLDNIRQIREDYEKVGEALWDRFKRGKEQQGWYYLTLVEAFNSRKEGAQYSSLVKDFSAEVQRVFGPAVESRSRRRFY